MDACLAPCKLLGRFCCRRGGSSGGGIGGSLVCSGLVGIAAGGSGAVGSVGGGIGGIGGRSAGSSRVSGSRGRCRLGHWSRSCHGRRHHHDRRLFLLATGGKGGNSDQRSQNEGFVHFKYSLVKRQKRQTDKMDAMTPSLFSMDSFWQGAHRRTLATQPAIILRTSQFWLTLMRAANGLPFCTLHGQTTRAFVLQTQRGSGKGRSAFELQPLAQGLAQQHPPLGAAAAHAHAVHRVQPLQRPVR